MKSIGIWMVVTVLLVIGAAASEALAEDQHYLRHICQSDGDCDSLYGCNICIPEQQECCVRCVNAALPHYRCDPIAYDYDCHRWSEYDCGLKWVGTCNPTSSMCTYTGSPGPTACGPRMMCEYTAY